MSNNPQELIDAADKIEHLRETPVVKRHKELETPLKVAEEWARKHFNQVTEKEEK